MVILVNDRPLGKRYLGNSNTKEVHDLRRRKTVCQLDETIRAGAGVVFASDTLAQARTEGYQACTYCTRGRR